MYTIVDGLDNFYAFGGIGELTCPVGWTPTWRKGDGTPGILVRPEYNPAGTPQTRTGPAAAAIRSRFATIDGALYREVNTLPGDVVTASVWMLKTEDGAGHAMRVGIDRFGGTDHTAPGIIWSEWYSQYADDYAVNAWREREATAVANGDDVTVFLQSRVDVATDSTNAHFDDVSVAIDEAEPEPPPVPDEDTVTVDVPVNLIARVTLRLAVPVAEVVGVEVLPPAQAQATGVRGVVAWIRQRLGV